MRETVQNVIIMPADKTQRRGLTGTCNSRSLMNELRGNTHIISGDVTAKDIHIWCGQIGNHDQDQDLQ